MIQITDKKKCCGCNACAESCPKGCIEMLPDEMGAMYPHVDTKKCVECGLCVHVCPFEDLSEPSLPIECYAAINKNEEERLASSSGGVFIELARRTIDRGGVVFGAVFAKDWSVVHSYAETMDDVVPMMGSKYVQSNTNGIFSHAKRFLEDGREVLFTGTPCQIAGLKHYLRKDYPNLLTVEVICHGAPMPGVWKAYLEETLARPKGVRDGKNTVSVHLNEPPVITGISFRDKRLGWKKFGFVLRLASGIGGEKNSVSSFVSTSNSLYENPRENKYMIAFLKNYSLRPSCYACKAKGGNSRADLTIGDFWSIERAGIMEDDDKGISCVICRTKKGIRSIKETILELVESNYEIIFDGNSVLEKSVRYTNSARRFQNSFLLHGLSGTLSIIVPPKIIIKLKRMFLSIYYFSENRLKRLLQSKV